MKPQPLGTVWTARANLYNAAGKLIATCTDTPNAIAKALVELPTARRIECLVGTTTRVNYLGRMQLNTCPSGLIVEVEQMPRINPSASYPRQDKELRRQLSWLKRHGYRDAREAQNAGH